MDHLANREHVLDSKLPIESVDLQKAMASFNLDEIAVLVLRRTEWMMQSLVMGSESFCRDMIATAGHYRFRSNKHLIFPTWEPAFTPSTQLGGVLMSRVSRLKSHLDGQAYHGTTRPVRRAFTKD